MSETLTKDLFGNHLIKTIPSINIYADEVQLKTCPVSGEEWFYIGIIIESTVNPLLEDLLLLRYRLDQDGYSAYIEKNNRRLHWSELTDIDSFHICKRWFEYILSPEKSGSKLYAYILGINNSKLLKTEFGDNNNFVIRYNRFFRTAILYAVKTFFPGKVCIKNIFHEEGPQQQSEYFPWHSISIVKDSETDIVFDCDEIIFLPKDHKDDKRSNIIQLCDVFMGACVCTIDGIPDTKNYEHRKKLAGLLFPLITRLINQPGNINSHFKHANRIMIRFFPKSTSSPDSVERLMNQFYTKRPLGVIEKANPFLPFD